MFVPVEGRNGRKNVVRCITQLGPEDADVHVFDVHGRTRRRYPPLLRPLSCSMHSSISSRICSSLTEGNNLVTCLHGLIELPAPTALGLPGNGLPAPSERLAGARPKNPSNSDRW